MKAFIERVFMAKKNKKEELLNEEIIEQPKEEITESVESVETEVVDTEEFPNFIDRNKKD